VAGLASFKDRQVGAEKIGGAAGTVEQGLPRKAGEGDERAERGKNRAKVAANC
jgi:hypothetical protein